MPQQAQNRNILQKIVVPLLAWYDAHARILPWRENTEPYAVWVSEIMLQQTRVEAVKPYYERFMKLLPTVQSLAKVKEDDLLKLWEGLGYYTRARNLKKAARMICNEYNGVFPNTYEQLCLLPGVGAYTAGAIASICFGLPTPAVDGNVMRVVSRLTENAGDIGNTATKQQITQELFSIYPAYRSGDFTQSLMELGALVCTSHGLPKCQHCPLTQFCKAYIHQTQRQFPVKAKKTARKQEAKTVFLLCFQDKIAIRKRQQDLLLGGLWEFPNLNGTLGDEEMLQWMKGHGVSVESMTLVGVEKHMFTHVEWQMQAYLVRCAHCNIAESPFLWVNKDTLLNQIALPIAFKKLLQYW